MKSLRSMFASSAHTTSWFFAGSGARRRPRARNSVSGGAQHQRLVRAPADLRGVARLQAHGERVRFRQPYHHLAQLRHVHAEFRVVAEIDAVADLAWPAQIEVAGAATH